MTIALTNSKRKRNVSVNPDQQMFQRLKNKIALLQKLEQTRLKELDSALAFLNAQILPQQKAFCKAFAERTILAYEAFTNKHWFSKKERRALKALILDDIDTLRDLAPAEEIPEEIEQIFETLCGNRKQPKDGDYAYFEAMKGDLEEDCKSFGIKLDLSNINLDDSEEEMFAKFFHSAQAAMEERVNSEKKEPKTKKQFEKANKRQKVEELQKRSLNTIYKQLVKAFHPDLELNPERKIEKEAWMKKLTVAYEEKDLFTLLSIEQEWIRSYDGDNKLTPDLKIYSSVLKEQIEALQARIDMLFLRPAYFPLQPFYHESFTGIGPLFEAEKRLKKDVLHMEHFVQELRTPQAQEILKEALQELR